MAFQQIPFASIAPLRAPPRGPSALRNLPKNFMEGMRLAAMPAELKRKAENEELRNSLSRLQAQYYPKQMESQLGLRGAQTRAAQQGATQKQFLTDLLRQQLGGGSAQGGASAEGVPLGDAAPVGGSGGDLRQALMRKMMGLPIETPREMQARNVGTFKEKEKFRETLDTRATRSRKQKMANAIGRVIYPLNEILESDLPTGQAYGFDILSPNRRADYKASIAASKDAIILATGLNPTDAGLHTAFEMIGRFPGETHDHYKNRLRKKIAYLKNEQLELRGKVPTKSTPPKPDFHPVVGPNGKVYMVPYGQVQQSLSQGGANAY